MRAIYTAGTNPHVPDGTIMLGTALFDDLGATGDYLGREGALYVVAHELGHAVNAFTFDTAINAKINDGFTYLTQQQAAINALPPADRVGKRIDVTAQLANVLDIAAREEGHGNLIAYNVWVSQFKASHSNTLPTDADRAAVFSSTNYYTYVFDTVGKLASGLTIDATTGEIQNTSGNLAILGNRNLSMQVGVPASHQEVYVGDALAFFIAHASTAPLEFNANSLGFIETGKTFKDVLQRWVVPRAIGTATVIDTSNSSAPVSHTITTTVVSGRYNMTVISPPDPSTPEVRQNVFIGLGIQDGSGAAFDRSSIDISLLANGSLRIVLSDEAGKTLTISEADFERQFGVAARTLLAQNGTAGRTPLRAFTLSPDGATGETTVQFSDPASYIPGGIALVPSGDRFVPVDYKGREARYVYKDGALVAYAVSEADVQIITTLDAKRQPVATEIRIKDNPLAFDFSDVGGALGARLGFQIAGDNKIAGVIESALFKTLGNNLGDSLDGVIGGLSAHGSFEDAFRSFGPELLGNLKSAGIGAISSYLTAELIRTTGIDGIVGETLNTAAGAVINQVITNITNNAAIFNGVNVSLVGSAVGSFLGVKLASQIVNFDTVGGQIGSAVGSSLGVIGATAALAEGGSFASLGAELGVFAGPIGAFAGAFLGFLAGGLIGSLFGGTPRSGADAQWDDTQGKFVVANVWSKKGGSKDAARNLATSAAESFNAVLSATGGTLLNAAAVQAGNYGMRKLDYVYQTTASKDQSNISFRISSKQQDAVNKVVEYGVFRGLNDPDFQIAGGDIYVKRAIYGTIESIGGDASKFTMNTLLGNIASAQQYENYLDNYQLIDALAAAQPGSVLAAQTVLTLVQAEELGLTHRNRSDWFGGFSFILKEAQANPADLDFGFSVDGASGQIYRVFNFGDRLLTDTINVARQTTIEASAADDVIDLRTGTLANQSSYIVNGHLNDDIAASGGDFTAKTASVSFAANSRRATVAVTVANDGVAEVTESFLAGLVNAPAMRIMGGDAVVTIINGTATLPTLMVGDSYAWEDDGFAVFRLSLSKAATAAVTVSLALGDGRASGAGVDFGSSGATNLQISSDGVNWTNATSATFAVGTKELFVRTAIVADNVANPAYVAGGTEPQFLNVEGNERFSLSATVTAGASSVANGTATVTGTGTIVDGAGIEPLVWIDDVIVDEATGLATFTLLRSRALSTAATVDFATADRRALTIDVAATIDGGDGNDTIYASNLGDNIFGGAGNDTLYGGRLDDWLLGGDGNDTLDAGTVDPAALGGDGNYLNGGAGNDTLRGREGSDWLEGGEGVDILLGGAGDDILAGGAGDGDDLKGGLGADQYLLRKGDGLDIAEEDASGAPAANGAGDAITQRMAGIALWNTNPAAAGAVRPDWVGNAAGVQQDAVAGGEDAVVLGIGIDMGDVRLQRSGTSGSPGSDLIIQVMQTVNGVETFTGTQLTVRDWFTNPFKRVEWLKFADGNEIRIGDITSFVVGGSGNDVLVGTTGNDFVYGGAGNDKLYLLAGDDVGNGGTGNDMVAGDAGRDLLIGGLGNDELIGGAGADAITGDDGADDIYGGADRDTLSGGRGDGDMVVGGAGDDTFRYARGDGQDIYFDDFAAYWDVVWTSAGGWNSAAGYAYDAATGEVTGPGGIVIRKNLGTVADPDLQWLGRYDYDSTTQTLKLFNPPANVTISANAGTDTIEFAPGINIQDVILRKSTNGRDLVLAISDEDEELGDTSKSRDSVTIMDWYLAPGQIEKLAFYQTGILDISVGATNLVAGTDAADGTIATPLQGTAGVDWITGAAGNDVIAGGSGNDILAGNSGFDTLKGEDGDDILYGGTGNDTLDGGAGKDILIGGAGQDIASYASASAAVRAHLSAIWANSGDATGDEYYGIEDLTGGSGADVLGGDSSQNELTGGAGNDTLMGNTGDDTYVWNYGNGADTIQEGSFTVQEAVTTAGNLASGYSVSIWAATGTKNGSNFYWRLQIKGPDDSVVYDNSTFLYSASSGVAQPAPSSYIQSGWLGGFARTNGQQVTRQYFDTSLDGGQDELEFGSSISLNDLTFIKNGNDLVIRYGTSTSAQVTIKNQGIANSAIETLKFYDGLSVSLVSVLVAANSSQLMGTGGDDLVTGQVGALDDILSGGAGNDVLVGYAGNDTLLGGDGDDVLEGGLGADTLDGGAHLTPASEAGVGDTARYVRSAAAVVVDLTLASAQAGATTSDSYGDILIGIENVTGSAYSDTLTGNSTDNRLFGLDGNDTIRGGAGNDVLTGDAGNDILYGDAGEDNIAGGDGNDTIYGGTEKDVLDGGDGVDKLYGEAGNDSLTGGAGGDTLDGGDGDDLLSGDADNDILTGGAGNDLLAGGTGNDTLNGGAGDDRFVFGRSTGVDTLTDTSGTNTLQFDSSASFDQIWLTRVGNDLRIAVIGGDTVVTALGFFLSSGASRIRAIETTTHAIFLDHPDTLNLVTAMTSTTTTPGVTPTSMPATIAAQLATYWHAGGKAVPTGPAGPRQLTMAEDGTIAVDGNYGVIDHDQNLTGYSVKPGAGPRLGSISGFNASTGAFTYTPSADANGTDSFTILATDADGQAVELPVVISITPVNDAPRNLAVQGGASLVVTESTPGHILTAGTVIGQLVATDPEGDALSFSLVNDATQRFAIDADGKLKVANPNTINFEAAQSHTIRVRVTDTAGASIEQDVIVSVQNGNEANALPASYSLNVAENVAIGTAVGTIAASDIDQTGAYASQRYYFLNGTSATETSSDGRYAINATTGQITTNATLNFESGSPSKIYEVIARDNAGATPYNQAQSAVTIGILDLNEANSLPTTYSLGVNENVTVGTVVGSVAATDLDGAGTTGAQQRYYFWNGTTAGATSSDGRYAINATTGQITTNAALNFEAGTVSVTYQIIARDNAGGAGYNQTQSAVTIAVRDVNEANSIPTTYAFNVSENVATGSIVGSIAASDIDQSGNFASQRYYFLNGTTASATSSDGRYAINATTGQITVNAAINFEAGTPSQTYQIIARDNAGATPYNQVQSAVTIAINDLNEAPVSLNWTLSVASVAERDRIAGGTSRPAIALGTISVSDPDTAGLPSASYTYTLSDSRFEIVGGTLRLRQDASFDYEVGASVTVTVTGTDQTGTPFTINRAIAIAVTNQDDIFEGTTSADTINGQSGRDIISGFAGNDVLNGNAGDDNIDGGDGADTINGGDGNDTLLGQSGDDIIYGGLGNDTIRGGTESDRLFGDDGNDNLYGDDGADGVRAVGSDSWRGFSQAGLSGGAGDDLLDGGNGDDYLDGGAGADQLIGGAGFDGVDYSGSTAAVTVNLAAGTGTGGYAQGDTLNGIELVNGSAYGDTLTGSAGSDVIYGGAGNDVIYGGAGNDYLFGGDGNDTISAEAGDDILDGGAGDDILNGGIDNDVYIVTLSSGADTINNYDPSGDDVDVIGFNDVMGAIADMDLWFDRIGDDLKISIVGTTSSVRISNWYVIADASSRANHQIDFIIANTSYSRTINIENLVTLMAGKTRPATIAERDTLMADLTYKAKWATYWNNNATPVITAITQQSTNEDTAKAVTVTATDDITPNAQIQMSAQVLSGSNVVTNAGISFGAADANGVRTMTINPVANASGMARIRVTATDAGGVFSSQEFDIVVAAVADTPTITQFSSVGGTSGYALGIPLNLAASFPDADGSEVQEIWITGVPASLTLNVGTYDSASLTWKLTTAQIANLKLLAPAGWYSDVTLTATGRVSENGQTAISSAVQMTLAINAAPTGATFSGSVNENAANGTTIGTVAGVDPDGDTLTYSIVDGAGGRFAISAAGVVSVGNATLINFETTTSHAITVRISDPRGEYIDRSFVIAVNNVNEANSLPAGYSFGINENASTGTLVGAVAASDLDAATAAFGQQRYYFWNGSATSSTSADGRYVIDTLTGQIKTNAVLNFEAANPTASYTIFARDNAGGAGYLQAQTSVTIAINNLNEQNSLPASYSFSVAEMQGIGTGVGTVLASDPDSSGAFADQRYFFWDGTNASSLSWDGRYAINANTGAITTNQILDFEAGSPSRAYQVIARDNAGSGSFTQSVSAVTIGIANVNETPNTPDNGATKWSFFDETGLGTNPANANAIVGAFSLSDPDGTTPSLRFSDGSTSQGWFYIDSNTVRFNAGFNHDFEWFRSNGYTINDWNGDGRLDAHVADVRVKAFDGTAWSGDDLMQVFISDVNETPNAPDNGATKWSFLDETGLGANPANTYSLVGAFGLSDPDGNTPVLRFADGSTEQGAYYIDGNTVRIKLGNNFDFEWFRANGYGINDWNGDGRLDAHVADVRVKAFDGSAWSGDELMQVFISDVNEAPNAPDNGVTKWSFLDETGFGSNPANTHSLVGAFGLGDPDGTTPQLRFSDGSTSQGWFYIDGNTVRLNPNLNFDFEWFRANGYGIYDWNGDGRLDAHVADVLVKAFDGTAWSGNELMQVFISDVNEPHTLVNASGSIAETTTPQVIPTFNLRQLMLSDPENGNGISWSFADGSMQNGLWTISPSGQLSLTSGTIDFEALTTRYQPYWNGSQVINVPVRDYSLATSALSIKAQDGAYISYGTFTASITNVDEGPILTSWASGSKTAYSDGIYKIYSGQSGTVVSVQGVDPDAVGAFSSPVTYEITAPIFTPVSPYTSYDGYYGTSSEPMDTPSWLRPNISINSSGQISISSTWWGYNSYTSYYDDGYDRWSYNSWEFYGSFRYTFNIIATDSTGAKSYNPISIQFMDYSAVKPPIVFDLDGDGLEIVSVVQSSTNFDVDQDGLKDKVGWIGPDDGFLALDRNGNGLIDDLSEITFANDLEGAISDLEGLRAFDSNADGVLDDKDIEFSRFLVWQDANSDGISQTGELKTLQERGISSINLTLTLSEQHQNRADSHIYGTSEFFHQDGTRSVLGDVFLGFELSLPPPVLTSDVQNQVSPSVLPANQDDELPSTEDGGQEQGQPESSLPATTGLAAPIIFDLDGDDAGLHDLDVSDTRFDMTGDGIADTTAWIEQGDAFLALDRNGNGTIDGISEISFVNDKVGARTDLEGLAAFDTNADGVLDGEDARFVQFRLWVDANADGKTDAGELLSLAEAGVTSIALTGTATGETQTAGKSIVYNKGSFTLAGGVSGTLLDVGLAYKRLSALPEITFQATQWEMKASKYRLVGGSGAVHVTPRSARGVLSADAGQIAGAALLSFGDRQFGMLSTILLDIDSDGLEARKASKSRAMFDMDGNGIADDTGWMTGGDGMLVIDRDGDGMITDPSEISFLSEKTGAQSAWEGLAVLDNNKDSKLTSADARFGELKVWVDRDGNGISQADEIKSLADLGIAEIGLGKSNLTDTVKPGENLALSTSTFKWTNGLTATIGNVALAFTPAVTPVAPGEASAALAAAGLAQAMSSFGADVSSDVLRKSDSDGMNVQDWLMASAA
ncbi:alkaline phosphatase [Novosphingobium sp. MD-1]|nr:alkaline phosphatase [Novosphingobium sp. MD-1]